jgi:hypothetical protein
MNRSRVQHSPKGYDVLVDDNDDDDNEQQRRRRHRRGSSASTMSLVASDDDDNDGDALDLPPFNEKSPLLGHSVSRDVFDGIHKSKSSEQLKVCDLLLLLLFARSCCGSIDDTIFLIVA